LVSPEVCWPDFVQNMAILDGLAVRGASSATAGADIVKR
jgi:hypothetical protein